MRIGQVIGHLTLARAHESVKGFRWKIVVPMTENDLRAEQEHQEPNTKELNTEELVVYDDLSVGDGQRIAFSEGAEASMPFFPNPKPIDAYNAAILDWIELPVE
ncbi:MAG: carbon dioxide concentrating mechanism protein CcmL [Planctomycetaceae bacterium]|jgi:ethanolamine utilization protein EutN|nr:carbon dioxide concentrating mechanism protein CcmL [Planctomycetaceae bacterium]